MEAGPQGICNELSLSKEVELLDQDGNVGMALDSAEIYCRVQSTTERQKQLFLASMPILGWSMPILNWTGQ
jgi:hypothetical protein